MGILKKHKSVFSIQCINLFSGSSGLVNIPSIVDVNGGLHTRIEYNYKNNTNLLTMIPVATSDTLDNYGFEDYQINAIGTTTFTTNRLYTDDTVNHIYNTHLVYNVCVQNTTNQSITINCIRFRKDMSLIQQGGSSTGTYSVLLFSYYLDEPMVLQPNDTQSVLIDFSVSYPN